MNLLKRILCTVFSAILLGLAIPNEFALMGSFFVGLFSIVPFYFAIFDVKNPKLTARLTGLLFFITHMISSFWLAFFDGFAIFTLGASALATYAFGCIMGRLLWLCLKQRAFLRPFLFACTWVVWEWLKSNGFLAYPWGTLIMTTANFLPIVQVVDITGTWGLSFLISLFAAVCGEWLAFYCGKIKAFSVLIKNSVFVASLFVLVLTYGFYSLSQEREPRDYLNVTVVQHNGDSWRDSLEKVLLSSQDLTREVAHRTPSDLIVWSEAILSYPYAENKNYFEIFPMQDAFVPFLQETGIPLLLGAPVIITRSPRQSNNSAILLSPQGELLKSYGKIQLVPFAEYIPFFEYEWMQKLMATIAGLYSSWTPGKKLELFSVESQSGKKINFTSPICFEDAFPNVCRALYKEGSDVFINLTNDSWSKTNSAEMQHFAIAFFRAVEFRTSMVRCTNSGFTCLLDPCGRVLDSLPLFVSLSKEFNVPIYPRQETFYCIFGDWLPFLCGLILVFIFFSNSSQIFSFRTCKIFNPLL